MRVLLVGGLIAILGAGCASSERMNRMSGGVFQEYSAPKNYRIRSQKFQAKTRALEKAGKVDVGNVEGAPVNVWPFFFSSDHYTSVLWPFIDWDRYGFAVRPFYNQEGDEHAVLFPLSAWNPVNGDGWVLFAAWNKHGFGFIPFCWQYRDNDLFWYYYTPLLIHRADVFPLTLRRDKATSFTELLLGYHYSERRVLGTSSWPLTPRSKYYLSTCLAGTGIPVPRTHEELNRMSADPEIAKKLPHKEKYSFGFIPLFHASYGPDEVFWRVPAYLAGGESSPGNFEWDVLGPFIARYRNVRTGPSSLDHHRIFFSLPLLTYFTGNRVLKDEGRGKILKRLIWLQYGRRMPFMKIRPEIEAELKKLDPQLKLPAEVTDNSSYLLYLTGLLSPKTFPTDDLPYYRNRHGGFLPLFWYEANEQKKMRQYFSLAGMTYFGKDENSVDFFSLPLLSYRKKRLRRSNYLTGTETFWIAPPLIWYSDRKEGKRYSRPVQANKTVWAPSDACTVNRNDFSALGLYYHGGMAYYAAKPGVDHRVVEELRRRLPEYLSGSIRFRKRQQSLLNEIKRLNKEAAAEERKLAKPTNNSERPNRIALLKKQLRIEEKWQELGNNTRDWTKLRDKIEKLRREAEKIGFRIDADALTEGKDVSADPWLDELFKKYTELRRQEDYGSGFFYRKEIFHNGDFHWRFMGFLAGGEKNGDREQCQILQFFYRYRRDGRKMEKICFPFVSIREDGTRRRFSFLGRVYQRTVSGGKTSGYILFIPF